MEYDLTGAGELYPLPLNVNLLIRLPLVPLLYLVSDFVDEGLVADVGLRLLAATRAAGLWWLLQRLGADDEV